MFEFLKSGRRTAAAQVLAARMTTPHLRCLTLGGPELAAFLQADGVDAPAAWVKVQLASGPARAYTIRRIDRAAGTLDLEFALHDEHGAAGPASDWAARARAGDTVTLAGPRDGNFAPPDDARWMLLAGDLTAMPALQRIAGALPAGMRAQIHVETASPADRQAIHSAAALEPVWLAQGGAPGAALLQTLLSRPLPPGPGYLWIAGESGWVRTLRNHYLQALRLEPARVSARGYWKVGEAGHRGG